MTTPWDTIEDAFRAYLTATGFTEDSWNRRFEDNSFDPTPMYNNYLASKRRQDQHPPRNSDGIDVSGLADKLARKLNAKNSGPTKTPATRGREEIAALRFSRSINRAHLNPELPPILTPQDLAQLQEDFEAAKSFSPKISPPEAAVTALLTPYITALVREVASETQSGLVISNTEYIQWLPPSTNSPKNEWKKPDLLTAHPAMLVTRKQNGGEGIVEFRNSRGTHSCNFGGVEAKQNSIGLVSSLWEGKCQLGNLHEALGDMVDYVQCVVMNNSMISFVLYDKFGFVGGYAKTGIITDLVVHEDNKQKGPSVIPWDAKGSKEVLKSLLRNRISERMVLLEKVKNSFNANWKSSEGTSPYLGSGGFGDVYRVEVEGNVQALKVVRGGPARAEFDTLKQAYNDNAPVVKVLDEKHEDRFSAYTMEPVGTPCTNHSPKNVFILFSSLFDLHLSGWYHGDARWQNAVMFEGKLLWCDFLSAKKFEPSELYYRACDLQTLAKSLLSRKGVAVPTVSGIEEMLLINHRSYDEIANFVTKAMSRGWPPDNDL